MAGKGFKQFLGTEGEVEQGARTPALPPPPATYSRGPRSKHTKGGGSWPQHRPASSVAHAPCTPTAPKCPRPGDTCPTLDANLPSL